MLDASLRADPPGGSALRARLALKSAAACAKIPHTHISADEATLRDLPFAVGDPLGPAANLLSLWRNGARRPPSIEPSRIGDAAVLLNLAVDPKSLGASLKGCAGEGAIHFGGRQGRRPGVGCRPGRPSAPSEIFALWVFDLTLLFGCSGRGLCR